MYTSINPLRCLSIGLVLIEYDNCPTFHAWRCITAHEDIKRLLIHALGYTIEV